jgi:prepilin-type N-terminal cleavage/methylation domain-containing protein
MAQGARRASRRRFRGFTLVEIMLGAAIISIALVALLGAFFGQAYLNEHARHLTAAMNDATRIMELIRQQNEGTSCTTPSARPPSGESWDTWLNGQSPGKSVDIPDRNTYEVVVVTCQNEGGSAYCGQNQTGTAEWEPWYTGVGTTTGGKQAGVDTTFDPVRVTVAVGWRQRQRVLGAASAGREFTYTPGRSVQTCEPGEGKFGPPVCTTTTINEKLEVGPDADGDGVIESQALLSTLVTCR